MQHGGPGGGPIRRRRGLHVLATATIALGLLAAVGPQAASARWRRIASGPSSSSPYFVCPPTHHREQCTLIEDPTRGPDRRGPVAAGAITAGPEEEASPALSGTGVKGGFSPEDLRSAYDLASVSAGSGETVAIVDAYNDPKAESDMGVYRSEEKVPPCTSADGCFTQVDLSEHPESNRKWATEVSLDLDMVSAICPNCHILLVEAKSTESRDLAAAENKAVALGATEISDSFAEGEAPAEAAAYDHPGIPIAAAGGDSDYGVVSPASYPGVIAVGGTTLSPVAHGWAETAWGDEAGGESSGTGSGCSKEAKPSWQSDVGCTFRTTNDVAAVADPNTPVSVYDSQESSPSWLLLGGTSVSAPIVAAAMALSNSYTRSFEGAEALYLEAAGGEGFNDVVSGLNGRCGNYLCQAGFGYDGPTGLGGLRGAPELPPPTPVTGTAGSMTSTGGTLQGTVDPHGGEVGKCDFEYGPTPSYGSSIACSPPPGPVSTPVGVSAVVTGLSPSTGYHFRLRVSYDGGTGALAAGFKGGSSAGTDSIFTTLGEPPAVSSGPASNVRQSSMRMNGEVDPGGVAVSHCRFEYGPSTSYGSNAPCEPSPGSGTAPVAVSAGVGGLALQGTYHYRLAATDEWGTSYGSDVTVGLLPEPPTVLTEAPSGLTATSATVNATVALNGGQATSCVFEFDSAETLVPCSSVPAADGGPVKVSAIVSGLRPGTRHAYRIIAANAGGSSEGAIEEFSTPVASSLPGAVLPGGGPGGGETTSEDPLGDGAARLVGTALVAGRGHEIRVRLSCPAAVERCAGTITLRTLTPLPTPGHPRARRILTLADASFAIRSGATTAIALRLSARAARLLGRSHALRARAAVRSGLVSGSALTSETIVTLRSSR